MDVLQFNSIELFAKNKVFSWFKSVDKNVISLSKIITKQRVGIIKKNRRVKKHNEWK